MPRTYQLDADSELPPHLLELFLRSGSQQLQALVDACGGRDATNTRAQAHKLKGSLHAVGASRLAESLQELRAMLDESDWPAAEQKLQAIRDDFAALCQELESRLGQSKS